MHACIRIHYGKTKVWNKAGPRPAACDAFELMARFVYPPHCGRSQVCQPVSKASILGTPLGHEDFVAAHFGVSSGRTRDSPQPHPLIEGRAVTMVFCFFIVRLVHVTTSQWFAPPQLHSSQKRTTGHCGNVCRTFTKLSAIWPPSFCRWEDWASGALFGYGALRTVPVVHTVCM